MDNSITLGSLFDGIGGFPYAASFYGIRSLWASEIVPECVAVTRHYFPSMVQTGDITRLNGRKLPPVDIVTFGSPCQGLSQAGLRLGLADKRSGLFMEAIRIIDEMREVTYGRYPRFALFENVPGALSSAKGRDFKAVLQSFTKTKISMPRSGRWANAGMVRSRSVDLAWCVYDAQYFGTAQRRRRLFLIADFRGKCAAEILFVPKSLSGYFEAGGTPRQRLAASAKSGPDTAGIGFDGYNGGITGGVAATLGTNCGMATGRNGVMQFTTAIEILNDQGGSSLTVERSDLSPTLRSQTHGNLPVVAVRLDHQSGAARTLCMGTGQVNAGIMEEQSPTLTTIHEPPILVHPKISGTLCASGVGLSRPAGIASETDFCIASAGFSYKAGSACRSVGYQEETAPTLLAEQPSGVLRTYASCAIDCRNLRETTEISGTLQEKVKSSGYSLNYQNPIRIDFCVRRLTPLEAERLQGFPDYWTECDDDGNPISDTKRYQMLGNSIAVPCVAYIMQGIQNALREST